MIVSPESERKSDIRRDWALIIVTGGGMAMTIYASAVLYIVHKVPQYAFWLGALAMMQIAIIFTGILGLLIKRRLSISRSEFEVSDFDDTIPREAAKAAVEEAIEEVPTNGSINKPS